MSKNYMVIDSHLDLGGIVYNNRKKGRVKVLDELFLEDFKKANLKFVIAAIFIENEFLDIALKEALLQIENLKQDIKECSNFMLIKNASDMDKALSEDKIGIIMSLEGLEPINRNIELLNTFYELGVRGFGVTWARRNFVADGSYFASPEEGVKGGVTPFGIKVLRKAEEIGYFIDVSHINDIGFDDVFKYTKNTIIASHSNSRSVNNILRNLNDKQIKDIASRGGIIGVNAYTSIVSENKDEQTIKKLCEHIDYMVKLTSDKNVGLGFDLCTKYYNTGEQLDVLKDHSEVPILAEELKNKGYSDESIERILGKNFYEVLYGFLKN